MKATLLQKRAQPVPVTDTPSFKAWFAGSKVVDDSGKPLVVYHGTQSDFDIFDTTLGIGSHFGTAEQASVMAGGGFEYDPEKMGWLNGAKVMPCYLSIKNPLRLVDCDHWEGDTMQGVLGEEGFDVDYPSEIYETDDESEAESLKRAFLLRVIKEARYDGIVYANEYEGGGDSWIVFSPNQVKSALNNSGAFDAKSDSITAAVKTASHDTLYRGAPTAEIKPRHFAGVFFSEDRAQAAQYDSHVWEYTADLDREHLLKMDDLDGENEEIAEQVRSWAGIEEDSDSEEEDTEESIIDLFMFPDTEWVKLLQSHGYTGTRIGQDVCLFGDVAARVHPNLERQASSKTAGKKYGPVYHGSRSVRETIKNDKYTVGMFFSSSPEVAKWYGPKVFEAYVTMSKPFVVDCKEEYYQDIPTPKQMRKWTALEKVDADNVADWAHQNGYDGVILKNVFEGNGACTVADDYIVFNIFQVQVVAEAPVNKTNLFGAKYPEVGEWAKKATAALGIPPSWDPEIPVPEWITNLNAGHCQVVYTRQTGDGLFAITVNNPTRATYIALFLDGKKIGSMATDSSERSGHWWTNISGIMIPPKYRGRGFGKEMYKALLAHIDTEGIASYLPNRSNKKQIPKIYKALGGRIDGDWAYIPKTAAITPTDRTLYHGTNSDEEFDELKPNQYGIIWLAEEGSAHDYRYIHYRNGSSRLFEVKLKESAHVVNLRDLNNPIAKEFKDQYTAARRAIWGNGIDDSVWSSQFADFGLLEGVAWAIPFLKEHGVDAVIVNDTSEAFNRHKNPAHESVAVLNPAIIESATVIHEEAAKKAARLGYIMAELPHASEAEDYLTAIRTDIDEDDLAGAGADTGGAHLTLRYGLIGDDIAAVQEYLGALPPIKVTLGATESFEPSSSSRGTAPIIVPIESADLNSIYEKLGEIGHFSVPDFDYRPHITVAYVKPEAAEKYVGDKRTKGVPVTLTTIVITDSSKQKTVIELGQAKTARVKKAMNITVPPAMIEDGHFWQSPPPGHEEFWAFRWPVRAQVGDKITFNLNKKPIAEAVIARIEKPGQSEDAATGKFKSMWKVYWTGESFRDLRGGKTAASDYLGRPIPETLYHATESKRRRSILTKGLLVRQPRGAGRHNDPGVYACSSPDDFGPGGVWEQENIALQDIWQIDARGLRVYPDECSDMGTRGSYCIHEDVPPSKLSLFQSAAVPPTKTAASDEEERAAANKYKNEHDFLRHHNTGYINSDHYGDEMFDVTRHPWQTVERHPKLLQTVTLKDGTLIELRQSGDKNSYTKRGEPDASGYSEILRGEDGMALSMSDEEVAARKLPQFDTTIEAFTQDGQCVGIASDEFGADGIWVRSDYQNKGLGTQILTAFRRQFSNVRQMGQMTSQGQGLAKSYYRSLTGKEPLPVDDTDYENDPDYRARRAVWQFYGNIEWADWSKFTPEQTAKLKEFDDEFEARTCDVHEFLKRLQDWAQAQPKGTFSHHAEEALMSKTASAALKTAMPQLPKSREKEIFYHGTAGGARAKSILQKGLIPNFSSNYKGGLRAVEGRSYVTTDLTEALTAAIALDTDPCYIFVIPGQTLVDDVQPDEDQVGRLAYAVWMSLYGGEEMPAAPKGLASFIEDVLDRDRDFDFADQSFAMLGKKLLFRMPNTLKLALIDYSPALAYAGTVQPKECWKFTLSQWQRGQVKADTFFENAVRVYPSAKAKAAADAWAYFNFRQALRAKPRPGDDPPARTGAGDPILYHGTSPEGAAAIVKEGFRPDNLGYVGFGTTPGSVSVFALRQSGSKGRILQFVLDKDWLAENADVHCEGSSRNLYLLGSPEGDRLTIPPAAIKDVKDVTERYQSGEMKSAAFLTPLRRVTDRVGDVATKFGYTPMFGEHEPYWTQKGTSNDIMVTGNPRVKTASTKVAYLDRSTGNAYRFCTWLNKLKIPHDDHVSPYGASVVKVHIPGSDPTAPFDVTIEFVNKKQEEGSTADIHVGPGGVTPAQARATVKGYLKQPPPPASAPSLALPTTFKEWLGDTKVTSPSNARDLTPTHFLNKEGVQPEPFMGGKYTIVKGYGKYRRGFQGTGEEVKDGFYSVFDGDKVIASFCQGALVVDKKYRGQGIGLELAKTFMRDYPNYRPSSVNRKSKVLFEKAFDELRNEGAKTASISLTTKTLWHGTATEFDQLKPNDYGIIWLGEKRTAQEYARQDKFFKGEDAKCRLIPVKVTPDAKTINLRDLSDPLVQAFKEKAGAKWNATHLVLENKWAIPWLRENGVDAVIVDDDHGRPRSQHDSLAVINPNVAHVGAAYKRTNYGYEPPADTPAAG